AGADAYIPKPFHHQQLKVRVEKLLEQRKKLREKYEAGNIKLDSEKYGIKEVEKRFLQEVEELVEDNLSNSDFTVAQLYRTLGYSRMQFYRKLKAITGLSANEFIRAYKIKKAAVYLRESHLNITEVLYEVGFSNRSYFSKCFKQTYGMTPREYLNQHKTQPA
ncbi:MAG: AraC family transcriptional regulator, partial [Bacteroidota bacterium]